jgi:hypothetical protein
MHAQPFTLRYVWTGTGRFCPAKAFGNPSAYRYPCAVNYHQINTRFRLLEL